MSDGESRRAPKGFEPPPWERERFEELARKRSAEQAEQEAARQAVVQAAAAAVEQAEAAPPGMDAAAPLSAVVQGEPEAPAAPAASATKASGAELDEKRVQAMLIDLSVEEPSGAKPTRQLAIGVAAVLAALSLVMLAMGIAFAARAERDSQLGIMGGAVLMVFGLFFAGLAAWLWVSSRRGRGD